MQKSKIGTIQEVIFPDFPDDDNTVTTTVTKSRRVSFGTNFVKEFIVGSAVSAQCMSEYEQASPSSDSSSSNSSHSVAESEILDRSTFVMHDIHKVHKSIPVVTQLSESDAVESRPKLPKFSSTICFSADSPTADMEFTEGCLTLAKSILDKKNKEMTLIIQAKPKESKDEEKPKEDETKYFNDMEESELEMSMTRCVKTVESNERDVKRIETDSNKWEESKENQMPLDMIIRHLDKDSSDLENELFGIEKSFNNMLNVTPLNFSNESEEMNFNETVDMSIDLPPNVSKVSEKSESPDPEIPEPEKPEPEKPEPEKPEPEKNSPEKILPCDREPSLIDLKVIESLKQQSQELGCTWSLEDFVLPNNLEDGFLSFKCRLLESLISIHFNLQMSKEGSLYLCSTVTNSSIRLNEGKEWRLPQYSQVVEFGFQQLSGHYEELRQKVETIRHIPHFLDQINSFMLKLNCLLQQIFSILTLYPGSTLKGCLLTFRLFSFPIFFSCIISIDLTNPFRLSTSSLVFEKDFGSFDENKIREIFQDCLKSENLLCDFVVQSTKYLVDLEKESGYVSKRGHIRLLPPELRL